MKKIISVIITAIILMLIIFTVSAFTGCELNDTELLHSRFEEVERNFGSHTDVLYVDKRTGVMYWYRESQGLTPLLDSDGKPLIYKGATK